MVRLWLTTLALAAACLKAGLGATSYEPVTFNQLIAEADVIFVGEVVDVRPFGLETRTGTVVKTRVTFRVSDPIWGTTSLIELLEFLGGELNGIGLEVAEMPRFAAGERRLVFARRERSINPIVGFTQGLFRISRDGGGVDRIFTQAGLPVAALESIGAARAVVPATPTVAMRLSDVRSRVSRALVEARKQ